MSTKKKESPKSNVEEELIWLEEKLENIRKYVDANPYHEVEDRVIYGERGVKVVATIEQQQKSLRDSQKEYTQLVALLDELREKEAQKAQARGNAKLSGMAQRLLDNTQ